MNMTDDLITGFWWWFSVLLYGAAMLLALWRAPWRVLLAQRIVQHLFLGATVFLIGLWQMRAGLSPGLGIHFIGATLVTLMLGWELALLSLSMALLAMTVMTQESWQAFTINGLIGCLLPVAVSYGHHLLVKRWLPKHFFIYLLVTVFLGAALTSLLTAVCTVLLLWFNNIYSLERMLGEYLVFLPLVMMSEALLNGVLMAALMLHYPNWIRTFGAKAYIDGQ